MQHITTDIMQQSRLNMIEQQVRPYNVLNPRLLSALGRIDRAAFVPPAHRYLSYAELEISLGHGQVMLTPMLQARLIQEAQAQKSDKALLVGAGTGYMAALLAELTAQVLAIEKYEDLANMAQTNLVNAGVPNAKVQIGDVSSWSALGETFDIIVLAGSLASLPSFLPQRLNLGGRLVAIVGEQPMMRVQVLRKTSEIAFETAQPWDALAPRLEGFASASAFSL